MADPRRPHAFDASHAASYDKNFEKLSAFKDALHILTRATLANLPNDARVLCVGAGTGAELLYLADAFPGWSFTALDTSGPMLEVCEQKAEASGCADRCSFHIGTVDKLDPSERYDAATSILVSQFVLDEGQRRRFFEEIRARLRDGGRLISADLACELDAPGSAGIIETWRGALEYNGASQEQLDNMFDAYRRAVAVIPESGVLSLLLSAGFHYPTRFFQAGLIHAWHASCS